MTQPANPGVDLKELRRLADAATPGPWKSRRGFPADRFEPDGYKWVQFGATEANAKGYGTDQLSPQNAAYRRRERDRDEVTRLRRYAQRKETS